MSGEASGVRLKDPKPIFIIVEVRISALQTPHKSGPRRDRHNAGRAFAKQKGKIYFLFVKVWH